VEKSQTMKQGQLKGLKLKLLLAESNKDSSKDEILELHSSITLLEEEIQYNDHPNSLLECADPLGKSDAQIEAHIKAVCKLEEKEMMRSLLTTMHASLAYTSYSHCPCTTSTTKSTSQHC
jgi:hypothetical protein